MFRKKFLVLLFVLIILSAFFGIFQLYQLVLKPNISFPGDKKAEFVFIPSDATFSNVLDILNSKELLINSNSFEWWSKRRNYINNVKSGKYHIREGLNNRDLINLLSSGNQTVVEITFNNLRNKEELAATISKQLEIDSASILDYITNPKFQERIKVTNYNVGCVFIPNTYEFYWNVSVDSFVKRMLKEYTSFWNEERNNKWKKLKKVYGLKLNLLQISILASIVEKEQNIRIDERPKIAGLYLNRLRKGMKLESDPTLIFALSNFGIQRVLNKDKKVNSPYNTYKYKGLPPGPICIPSINSIDAVLNAVQHDYIFMCAKPDGSGYHNFARKYTQHRMNARKYQRALNKRRIMR